MVHVLVYLQVLLLAGIAKGQWPCPDEADIAPCKCEFPDDVNMDLFCTDVKSDADLEKAFNASFPFNKFRYFEIFGSASALVPITTFNANTFGDIYFQFVNISYTTLHTINGDPFAKSQGLLETMEISHSNITSYPFDTLQSYVQLYSLQLHHNQIGHMADITSPFLQILIVNNNEGLKYGDGVFYNAEDIRTLNLQSTGQTNVAPNTFRYNKQLWNLNLSGNQIHILWKGSFWFESKFLQTISINSNELDTVAVGAFGVCDANNDTACIPVSDAEVPNINMVNNVLTDLPKDVWERAFSAESTNAVLFDFTGNQIRCGCNIAWMVVKDEYLSRASSTSSCDNGDTFADLDPAFFNAMCIAPSTVAPTRK